jgi:energy-coupling factor transporter ATP-binding protein EcfA2
MYELENISLHNWYLFEAEDVSIWRETGIIGGTGAGKSSLLDAIQTVMSGNNRNVIDLNSAAGERQDRSVRDYCLGCVSDVEKGRPQRDRCETTVALSYRDRDTNHVVSMGVLLTADKDQTGEQSQRFVADGYAFRIADFVEREGGEEYVVGHEAMIARLRGELGPSRFATFQNSTRYVADYLQRMRPKNPPDAKTFLRSFGNAMKAKGLDDPTVFVRNFVLEPLPLDIKRVQESISIWRGLEAEISRLERMLEGVKSIRGRFATGFRRKLELETAQFMEKHLRRLDVEAQIDAHREKLQKAAETRGLGETIKANAAEELRVLRDELVAFKTARADSNVAVRLDALTGREGTATRHLSQILKSIAKAVSVYVDVADLRQIADRVPASGQAGLRAAAELAAAVGGRPPQEWLEEADKVVPLFAAVAPMAGLAGSLRTQRDAVVGGLDEKEARLRAVSRNLDAMGPGAGGGTVYSAAVLDFMEELAAAGIDAVPLPEVVDIDDEEWAAALESLLGPNREALIVPEAKLDQAFDILYRNRRRFHTCRLVNTRRSRRSGERRLPKGSIAAIVSTDDHDARAFIDYNVGRYVRADGPMALDELEFGVLKNGKTNSGLSKRVHLDLEPILGKAARQRAVEALSKERDALAAEVAAAKLLSGRLEGGAKRLEALAGADPEALADQLGEAFSLEHEIRSLRRQSEALAGSDDAELAENIDLTEKRIADCEAEVDEGAGMIQKGIVDAGIAEAAIARETALAAELMEQEEELRALQAPEAISGLLAHVDDADKLTIESALVRLSVEAEFRPGNKGDRRAFLRRKLAEVAGDLESRKSTEYRPAYHMERASRALSEFCHEHYGRNPLPEDATHLDEFLWLVGREEEIADNELRRQRENVKEARAGVETALKEDLLTRLGENFERLDLQLKTLNDRLGRYTFVGQRYVFTKAVNLAMKPIHDLVKKLESSPERGLLGFAAEGGGQAQDVAEGMMEIERLVGSEIDAKDFEDYRKYFEFELNLDSEDGPVPFSKIEGVLSGGQRQAPYYVAIAASMVSAYYPRAKTGETQGMGLIVFDEAFDKLDIPNTQALIKLFRSLGLQVIVAAPEEKRASLRECVDSIVNVNRIPRTANVFVETIRINGAAHEAMRRENPAHKGVWAFKEGGSDGAGPGAPEPF